MPGSSSLVKKAEKEGQVVFFSPHQKENSRLRLLLLMESDPCSFCRMVWQQFFALPATGGSWTVPWGAQSLPIGLFLRGTYLEAA